MAGICAKTGISREGVRGATSRIRDVGGNTIEYHILNCVHFQGHSHLQSSSDKAVSVQFTDKRPENRITDNQRPTMCLSVSNTCIILPFDRVTSVINTPPSLAFTCVNINHVPSGISENEKLPCASH